MRLRPARRLGQPLAFKLSGEGTLQSPVRTSTGGPAQGPSAQTDNRPGGGLGPPIDAPDPLQKYRWYILGGFAAALVIGGVFVASRQQAANRAARSSGKVVPNVEDDEDYEAAEASAVREGRAKEVKLKCARPADSRPQAVAPRAPSSMLLEGLKEELFQLEVEHKQGRISQQEYENAKAALDHTLERALKREATKPV